MRNRIIAVFLTFALSLSYVSVIAFASADNPADFGGIEISQSIESNPSKEDNIKEILKCWDSNFYGDGEAVYFYRDGYFLSSADIYNEHLATLSLAVSLSACADFGKLYNDEYRNAEQLFADTGFDTIKSNTDTDSATTPETMGVILAKKTIFDSGEPYTLVAVGFRSGGYGSEWANNFIVGTAGECPDGHLGFHQARDRALEFILDYLDRNVEGNTKLWISGYSRGGAIGGLTGAWFNDNREALSQYGISLRNSDIFTYTFEAPASIDSKLNQQRNYNNIFNIISPNDIIPLIPFEFWGLVRPGKDHYLSDFTGDDADKLIKILDDLNSSVEYELHKFDTFPYRDIGKSFAEFLNNFCNIFAARIDRDTYANKLQNTLSRILDKILNCSEAEMELLIDTFAENFLQDLGIDVDGDIASGIVSLISGLIDGDRATIDKVSSAAGKNLAESGFIEVCDSETIEALNLLISTILYRADGYNLIPYAFTIVLRCPNIFIGHTPDIILAAVMSADSYYTQSNSIAWSSGYTSNTNTATISINDGKKVYTVDYNKGTTLTLTARATGCVEFCGWYVGGELVTDSSALTIVADENMSVRAAGKLVHKELGEWSVDNAAVLFFSGSMSRECSACGAKHSVSLPAPLAFDNPLTYIILSGVLLCAMIAITSACVSGKKRKRTAKIPTGDSSDDSIK